MVDGTNCDGENVTVLSYYVLSITTHWKLNHFFKSRIFVIWLKFWFVRKNNKRDLHPKKSFISNVYLVFRL